MEGFSYIFTARGMVLSQEAEGHLQTHVRGHFPTQRQNMGVIFKHTHTDTRQEQHLCDIYNVFICQGIL